MGLSKKAIAIVKAAEARKEIPAGTAASWAKKDPGFRKLSNRHEKTASARSVAANVVAAYCRQESKSVVGLNKVAELVLAGRPLLGAVRLVFPKAGHTNTTKAAVRIVKRAAAMYRVYKLATEEDAEPAPKKDPTSMLALAPSRSGTFQTSEVSGAFDKYC